MRQDLEDVDWTRFTGRPLRSIDPVDFDYLAGKTVLITGAGGSIGSALARAVARLRPHRLLLLDHAEAGLAELQRSLVTEAESASVAFVLGSFFDGSMLRDVFHAREVQVVFHAAACKHVPLLEDNPFTAVGVNALGTDTLINTACDAGVEQFVLLSTDKAVEPVSVLGATKRVAELTALAARVTGPAMKVLRLCNVLGSTGSVAPTFAEQIRRGGPITLTQREAKRYFITIQEAVAHLLDVLRIEPAPSLWVPRVEEQQSIESLAGFLQARLNGSASLICTGLRPGDKLLEKLRAEDESVVPGEQDRLVRLLTPAPSTDQLRCQLESLRRAVAQRDGQGLLHSLGVLVPAYRPSERVLATLRSGRKEVSA